MSYPLVKIDKKVLARVRKMCLGWPEVSEDVKWGCLLLDAREAHAG